jgi:outer membrane lipoprotein-sorting protein
MRKIFLSFLLLFSFSFGDENLQTILKKYYYSKLDFVQKTYIKDLDETQTFDGTIYIKKPFFRIDYKQPYNQIILVKEDGIYIYNPQEKQLIITSTSQDLVILNILNILSGKVEINDFFSIKKENNSLYVLKSQKFKDIKEVKLFVYDNKINKIEITDSNDNIVEILIKNTVFDKSIKINYDFPENIDIIDYRREP